MKKKKHYSYYLSLRLGDEDKRRLETAMENTRCKSKTKAIREAILHYYIQTTIAKAEQEERAKTNGR